MTTTKLHCRVRWLNRRDYPEVLAIEQASFEYPWSEEEFLRVLRQRTCIGTVAEHGQQIVGFMVYELRQHALEILDFAVYPRFRRRGVGAQMVAKLVGKLSTHHRTSLGIMVRESNLDGLLFLRSRGFLAYPRFYRGHFADSGEDGYMMKYHLEEDD